jgi:hypothetical protein
MDADITLYPGQMQQMRFVMPTDLTFTAISDWDYGITIVVNHQESLSCFTSGDSVDLQLTDVLEISNAGLYPFAFTIKK